MAAQSNDIKQLFSHLGLNPGDYLEIRPKPSSNATIRRPAIPDGILPTLPKSQPGVTVRMTSQPTPQKVAATLPAVVTPVTVAMTPASVAAAPITADMTGDNASTVALLAPTATPPAAPLPPQADPLRSLFQQVKEPLTAGLPVEEEDANHEQPLHEAIAETQYVPPTARSRRGSGERQSTSVALDAALARLKDVPLPLHSRPTVAQTGGTAGMGGGSRSLQDVFQRLSQGSRK